MSSQEAQQEPVDNKDKSTVKTYRPPDGSPPVICIHTTPTLMKRLAAFLRHFDRPPQQLFLEFAFVEVEESNVAQFRYKLTHPILEAIYGSTVDEELRRSMLVTPQEASTNGPLSGLGNRNGSRRLPESLNPRM
ncbi:arylsulfatase E [Acrasis kona]|uniref:Arylsulfatase E n=1 Tax=Acrasis kona TaxID=1008807 RepID=A0AAW2YZ48_9EUKA